MRLQRRRESPDEQFCPRALFASRRIVAPSGLISSRRHSGQIWRNPGNRRGFNMRLADHRRHVAAARVRRRLALVELQERIEANLIGVSICGLEKRTVRKSER